MLVNSFIDNSKITKVIQLSFAQQRTLFTRKEIGTCVLMLRSTTQVIHLSSKRLASIHISSLRYFLSALNPFLRDFPYIQSLFLWNRNETEAKQTWRFLRDARRSTASERSSACSIRPAPIHLRLIWILVADCPFLLLSAVAAAVATAVAHLRMFSYACYAMILTECHYVRPSKGLYSYDIFFSKKICTHSWVSRILLSGSAHSCFHQ